jgi:hypothetical protein
VRFAPRKLFGVCVLVDGVSTSHDKIGARHAYPIFRHFRFVAYPCKKVRHRRSVLRIDLTVREFMAAFRTSDHPSRHRDTPPVSSIKPKRHWLVLPIRPYLIDANNTRIPVIPDVSATSGIFIRCRYAGLPPALLTDLYCNFQGEYRMAGLDPILYISDRPVWNARPGTYH